jgi:hypothetical protein
MQSPNNPRENFFTFLKHSTVSLLSNSSSYGIIFKVDLKEDSSYKTPYYMFRSKNFGEPITSIVLKICPLVDEPRSTNNSIKIGTKTKLFTVRDEFLKEYYNTLYIALDTCKYLEPACPFPIYIDLLETAHLPTEDFSYMPTMDALYNDDDDTDEGSPTEYMFNSEACLNLLISTDTLLEHEPVEQKTYIKNTKATKATAIADESDDEEYGTFGGGKSELLAQLINGLREKKYDKIGIIAMELASGFQTLKSLEATPEYGLYKNYARYELMVLAIEQQIVHCDFHTENLMINSTYERYFDGYLGKCLLIDFGLTTKIEYVFPPITIQSIPDIVNKINDLSNKNKNYQPYIWFNKLDVGDIDIINDLFVCRERSKQQLVEYSQRTRAMNNTSYPSIPLKLIDYQKHLPKMAHGMFFSGGGREEDDAFYKPTTSPSTIFETMIFGTNVPFKFKDSTLNSILNNNFKLVPNKQLLTIENYNVGDDKQSAKKQSTKKQSTKKQSTKKQSSIKQLSKYKKTYTQYKPSVFEGIDNLNKRVVNNTIAAGGNKTKKCLNRRKTQRRK